jgi:hypothetical protein
MDTKILVSQLWKKLLFAICIKQFRDVVVVIGLEALVHNDQLFELKDTYTRFGGQG